MIHLFSINGNLITEIKYEEENFANALTVASWIDALSPTEEERGLLQGLLRDDVPESEDVEEIEDSARCFIDQSGIHVHSLFITQGDGRKNTVSVACILQQNRLITIRDEKIADFRLFRMRGKKGFVECTSPATLLISLLEHKVENLADSLEEIHRQLDTISTSVLGSTIDNSEELVSFLATLEDGNGKIRLCLMDTQRDISFLQRHSKSQPDLIETCREIMRDIDTLLSHTTFLFDKINFLMGFMQGYINIRQNQIIKIFSIAAVVFLPPTLVASIYGMNFQHMPELEWLLGYPFAVGLMVASGIAPYWYFKRKGWL